MSVPRVVPAYSKCSINTVGQTQVSIKVNPMAGVPLFTTTPCPRPALFTEKEKELVHHPYSAPHTLWPFPCSLPGHNLAIGTMAVQVRRNLQRAHEVKLVCGLRNPISGRSQSGSDSRTLTTPPEPHKIPNAQLDTQEPLIRAEPSWKATLLQVCLLSGSQIRRRCGCDDCLHTCAPPHRRQMGQLPGRQSPRLHCLLQGWALLGGPLPHLFIWDCTVHQEIA